MNYKIVAKYIKSLNFDIPDAETFFLLSKKIGNYKINIDIKSNQFKSNFIEIETSLNLNNTTEDSKKINTKITHSTIIELDENIKDKNELEKIILIKVPNEIYSEIRDSFIFLFERSGFKDVKIDKRVDFQKLYNENKKMIQ